MATVGKLSAILSLNAAQFTGGIKNATRSLRRFGRSSRGISSQLSVLKAGFAALGGYAALRSVSTLVNKYADFEKQLAAVNTMLDDTSRKMLPQYKRQLTQTSIEFGESTETLTKGLYDILSAGVNAGKAMDVLRASSKAATAGLSDTATASKAVTQVLNAYKMDAGDAGHVFDMMFKTIQKGVLTFEDLAGGIGETASIASAAEIPIGKVLAAIGTLSKAMPIEDAFTALNASIVAFLKPTKDAVKLAKQYHLEMGGATLATEGLYKAFAQLERVPVDALAKMFPRKALLGAVGLSRQLPELVRQLENTATSAGALQENFAIMADTTAQKMASAKMTFAAAARDLGEALAPFVSKLASGITKLRDFGTEAKRVGGTLATAYMMRGQFQPIYGGGGRFGGRGGGAAWREEEAPGIPPAALAAMNASKEQIKAAEKQANLIQALREKWGDLAATYGLSAVQLARYEAAQLGVDAATQKYIVRQAYMVKWALEDIEAQRKQQDEAQRTKDSIADIFQATRTPMEKFFLELAKIRDLMKEGLGIDTANRYIRQLWDEMQRMQAGGFEQIVRGRTVFGSRIQGRSEPPYIAEELKYLRNISDNTGKGVVARAAGP